MSLNGLRVLSLGRAPGVSYASRIFANLGAVVEQLVPPFPQAATIAQEAHAAWLGWLDVGKQTLVPEDLASAVANADVVLDGRSREEKQQMPIEARDSCSVIQFSWFGEQGPYADRVGSDLICRAAAGLIKLAGPVEGPPVTVPGYQVEIMAGLTGFTAAAVAVYGGEGRVIEHSAHESAIVFSEYQNEQAKVLGGPVPRLGVNVFWPTTPAGVFACREGWLGVTIITAVQWQACCDLLQLDTEMANPDYITNAGRIRDHAILNVRLGEKLKERSAQEWFEAARKRKLPWVIVPEIRDLCEHPIFSKRGAFESLTYGDRPYVAPRVPIRPDPATPSDNDPESWVRSVAERRGRKTLPLEGMVIVDLSMGWAGPLATRQLADLGAEVIKVEACQYVDWWRGHDPRPEFRAARGYEKTTWFNAMNRNKLGITLDLASLEGKALLRKLVRQADAVVENYTPDVLPKLGLDYTVLSKENPALVMLSMPGFSSTSAWADVRAYGSTIEQACGLPTVSGYHDGPPTMSHLAYGDPAGGLNGAAALMAALLERKATGRGRHIDLPQSEGMLPYIAYWLIHHSLHGTDPERNGMRDPVAAPHGVFQCAGEDKWVAIAVMDDRQWEALVDVLGDANLAFDNTLRSEEGRKRQESRIEQVLSSWCQQRSPVEIVTLLQSRGVPASEVLAPVDLTDDQHLCERRFWQKVAREYVPIQHQVSLPFREGGRPYPVFRPGPTLGKDTNEVLARRLGLTAQELDDLASREIIGTAATGGKIASRLQELKASA